MIKLFRARPFYLYTGRNGLQLSEVPDVSNYSLMDVFTWQEDLINRILHVRAHFSKAYLLLTMCLLSMTCSE